MPEWPSLAEKKLFGSPASGHLIVQAAMSTDQELLQRYLREGSEPAFTEIVCRHVDLVYGTALRQLCGNTTLAQDVTQAVFTALAAKPAALLSIRHFSAWLYTTTRFTVSHTVRTERRRQDREQKAHAMHAQLADSASPDLPPIPPELFDQVLEELDDDDREAVLLRFFEGKPFATVGAALGVGEDAARMRVARALEKIRALFARHGITSSAAAVGAALAGQAVAAPAHLAASVSTLALAGTAAAQLGLLSSATLMTTATKAALALTGTLTVFAFGTAFSEHRAATARRVEIAALTQEQTRLTTALRESEHRASALAERATQAELLPVAPKTPAPLTEERRALLARMAQMKPLLAAGQPIKGAIIVLVDDKPVQRPVEFVMGRETRFPVSDDGTYVVTPTLNEDGSVKYKIALLKSDPTTGQEKSATLSSVTHYPWGSFTLSSAGGKIIAFDPDKNEP